MEDDMSSDYPPSSGSDELSPNQGSGSLPPSGYPSPPPPGSPQQPFGAPGLAQPVYAPPKPSGTSGLAFASLVLGLPSLGSNLLTIGFVLLAYSPSANPKGIADQDVADFFGLCTAPLSLVIGIAGVICGFLALSQIKASSGAVKGRRLAIAGLVLNWIAIAISVAYFVGLAVLFAKAIPTPSSS